MLSHIPITNKQIDDICDEAISKAAVDDDITHSSFGFIYSKIEYLRNYAKEDLENGIVNGLYMVYYLIGGETKNKL
jgi:hypothetical protein